MRKSAGIPPTVRGIRDALGISSASVVNHYLDKLVKQKRIWREPREARNIRVVGAEWQYAAPNNGAAPVHPRPKCVCLCGSTRFYEAFQKANYEETMKGHIVLTVGFYPHSQGLAHGEILGVTPEQKAMLDELHLQKIDVADEILVLNVGNYIGRSTANEICYAQQIGRAVRYLEPPK
jgi:hypothetical protein